MKLLDVVGTGAKAIKAAVVAVVAPQPPRRSREAREELERRERINAEADAERAHRARTWGQLLDEKPSWLGHRRGWLR